MDYEQFNEFCKALPATTYVMQWNNSHVWKVGGKVFAIGGWGQMISLLVFLKPLIKIMTF